MAEAEASSEGSPASAPAAQLQAVDAELAGVEPADAAGGQSTPLRVVCWAGFTCHEVASGLFQGDFPEGEVDWGRFDDVVSMSMDAPSPRLRPDGLWLHVPIPDGEMEEPELVRDTARLVAERVASGRRVLVHCLAGLNRSGVVAARALMFMGTPAAEAIAAVRAARGPNALFNEHFVAWLHEEDAEPAHGSGRAPGVPAKVARTPRKMRA